MKCPACNGTGSYKIDAPCPRCKETGHLAVPQSCVTVTILIEAENQRCALRENLHVLNMMPDGAMSFYLINQCLKQLHEKLPGGIEGCQ